MTAANTSLPEWFESQECNDLDEAGREEQREYWLVEDRER